MAKSLLAAVLFLLGSAGVASFSFSLSAGGESKAAASGAAVDSRRAFLSTSFAAVIGGTSVLSRPQPSHAATAKEIITLPSGIKYAVTKEPTDKKPTAPLKGETNDA